MDFLAVIGVTLGLIGAISSTIFLYEKWAARRRLTWRFVEKSARRIAAEMAANNFSPTLIVGIGRGGAIMGALISGVLGHRPLIVIDRKYEWQDGRRIDDMIFHLHIDLDLDRVLIVAGEVHTGNTMRLYWDYLEEIDARRIHRATLYYEKGATEPVEYKGKVSSNKNLLLPWQLTKEYRRGYRLEDGE